MIFIKRRKMEERRDERRSKCPLTKNGEEIFRRFMKRRRIEKRREARKRNIFMKKDKEEEKEETIDRRKKNIFRNLGKGLINIVRLALGSCILKND